MVREEELKDFATLVNQQLHSLVTNFQGGSFQEAGDADSKYYLRFLKYLTNLIISINNMETNYIGYSVVDKINVQASFFFAVGFESENDLVY